MQIETERGLISVKAVYQTKEEALKAGYMYSFHSKKLGKDIYGKSLDRLGYRHQFVLINE